MGFRFSPNRHNFVLWAGQRPLDIGHVPQCKNKLLEMIHMIILGRSNGSPIGEAIWNKVKHDIC